MSATTTFENITKKITNYLGSNWTATSIQYPNTDLIDISSLNYFISLNIVPFPSRRLCITGDADTGLQYKGQIVIGLYRRIGKGTGGLNQYVDDICDLFRYYSLTWGSEKIQFYLPSVNEIGNVGDVMLGKSTSSDWYQINVSIPWEYLT